MPGSLPPSTEISKTDKHVFPPSGILLTISGHPDLEKHSWMQIRTDIGRNRWLSSFESQVAKAKKYLSAI